MFNPEWTRFTRQGEGDPVILIHGIAASRYDWENLAPALAGAGFRAYAPDLIGHGESQKPDERQMYTARTVYALLENWIDSLQLERPPFIVGHSLGGYLSLLYSLRHPERTRGLVLIDPFYSPHQIRPVLRRMYRRPEIGGRAMSLAPEWLLRLLVGLDISETARFSPHVRRQIAADIKRASPHILHIIATAASLTPQLSRLSTPTTVIWGENDQTLDPASFPRLVFTLPNASGHPLPGCGHQPHVGKPEVVNRLVLDFFRNAQSRPAGARPSAAVDGAAPAG